MSPTRRSEFRVPRRGFLKATALALGAGGLTGALRLPRVAADSGEALSYEEFLALAVPLAQQLSVHETRAGEDCYLLTLASLAARITDVPEPSLRRVNDENLPAYWLGNNDAPADCPFTVLHWKLAPHAVVRPHPHTYGNVVTLGLQGEVRIGNHETVDAPDYDATGEFLVRRVHDQVLRPHDINLVPLRHGFIHGFVAGDEGARGLDITTRVRDKQPNLSVTIEAEPADAQRALYTARWVRAG